MNRDVKPSVYIPLLGVVFLLLLATIYWRVSIQDWWFFLWTEPSDELQQIAIDAGLSEQGSRLLWRTNPQFVDQTVLNERCGDLDNIGCLVSGPQMYIKAYDTSDRSAYNQAVVTAVHEMLHLAYYRLDDTERSIINAQLEEAVELISDEAVRARIEQYPEAVQIDEAHSILPTEYQSISNELQNYYQQYFSDSRQAVLAAFEQSRHLLQSE